MLTTTYIQTIGKSIEEHRQFKRADFKIDYETEKVGSATRVRLEIIYLFEPKYRFLATIPVTNRSFESIDIKNCPGEMFESETLSIDDSSGLLTVIKKWISRVDAEIKNLPLRREIELQQQQIAEILEQLEDIPGTYFSKEEGETLREKLAELEQKLIDNQKTATQEAATLKANTEQIVKDMSVLKASIDTLSKKGWTKAFVSRTFEWLKDPTNRKVLKAGAEVAKELLLEAGDHLHKGQ